MNKQTKKSIKTCKLLEQRNAMEYHQCQLTGLYIIREICVKTLLRLYIAPENAGIFTKKMFKSRCVNTSGLQKMPSYM